jgi:hypothetical protein
MGTFHHRFLLQVVFGIFVYGLKPASRTPVIARMARCS